MSKRSKRTKTFLKVIRDETGEVVDIKFVKQIGQYDPHLEKMINFRRHGNNYCCNRNQRNDGNFRSGRTPKCCEKYDYTSVYQARFAAERALHDGFRQQPDSGYDFEAAENEAKAISARQEEKAYQLYISLKSYFKD